MSNLQHESEKDGLLLRFFRLFLDAYYRFVADDGWAMSSHVALSALISLFPFLIFVTSLAGFFGSKQLADEVIPILFESWPAQASAPISTEIHNVLMQSRGDLLTIGVLLLIYFSSNGIEAMRIGLNRAYDGTETRPWWLLRLESTVYVLIGALALLILALLVVLGPLLWAILLRYLPAFDRFTQIVTLLRFAAAGLVVVVALIVAHKVLPHGHRSWQDIWLGILFNLVLMLVTGDIFAGYLARFAGNYVSTYAGLASAIITIAFLYSLAATFIFGGELNAAWMRQRGHIDEDQK